MRIQLDRETLLEAMKSAVDAAGKTKDLTKIISGIKIVAEKDKIIITGSDNASTIESIIPCMEDDIELATVKEPGAVVLPGKKFNEYIKKFNKENVNITFKDISKVIISSGQARYTIGGLDAEEYPRMPEIKEDEVIKVITSELKEAIRQTTFAVSNSEAGPILQGVNITHEGDKLVFTATDSYRLSKKHIKCKVKEGIEILNNCVIPGKVLNEINKMLVPTNDIIEIIISETNVQFRGNNFKFHARLLEGTYPDTSRLIPEQGKTEVIIEKNDLLDTIGLASLINDKKENKIVKVDSSKDELIISSKATDIGDEFVAPVKFEKIEGEDISIAFNAEYIEKALSAIGGKRVKIIFNGGMRPFTIHSVEKDDVVQLVLPVRITQ